MAVDHGPNTVHARRVEVPILNLNLRDAVHALQPEVYEPL